MSKQPDYLSKLNNKGIKHTPLKEYISARVKIPHKCPYNHIWNAEPKRILEGRGCPICSGRLKKTTKQYQEEILKYNIKVLQPYEGTHKPILHKCANGHKWIARPSQVLHKKGVGCPSCANYCLDLTKPCYLYYIKLIYKNKNYYKIGITSKTVSERFINEKLDIFILYEFLFISGYEAKELEDSILKEFEKYIAINCSILKGGGNTEVFHTDVLGFDIH